MHIHKNRIPSYCCHKASRQAVVRLDGCDHYLGLYGSQESRKKYDTLIARWLGDNHDTAVHGGYSVPQDLTINELLVHHLDFAERYYIKNGAITKEVSNLKYAMKPLAELFGSSLVSEFGPLKLKSVRGTMVNRGLARKLINGRINRIRRIFRWGVENQLVTASVLEALRAVSPLRRGRSNARETKGIVPVPDAHVDAVLQVVPPTLAAMIEVQRLTGMRPGELVIMRPCDIDMSHDTWFYKPRYHKTEHFGVEREIPLGPRAQELIGPLVGTEVKACVFSPKAAMAERHAARKTHRRHPNKVRATQRKLQELYTTQSYGRAIAYAAAQAKVPHWSPNQLRHAAGTRIRQDFGLDKAQAVLGHRTARVTEVYAQLRKEMAAEVMAAVG